MVYPFSSRSVKFYCYKLYVEMPQFLFFSFFLRYVGLSLLWPLPLWSTGSGRAGSAAMAHGRSRSVACGIFPDRGTNPCPLRQQADSLPLRHQGSPILLYFFFQTQQGQRRCLPGGGGSEKQQNKSMIFRNTRMTRPTHVKPLDSHVKSLICSLEQISEVFHWLTGVGLFWFLLGLIRYRFHSRQRYPN